MDLLQGKRLVIFGCGYVGSALAHAAVEAGGRVAALTRSAARAEALRAGLGLECLVADLASDEWHDRIGTGPAFVVNCVGAGGGGPAGYRHSYVGGMQSILRWLAAAARPVGTLVYTSSTSVYPQDGGVTVDEEAETSGTEAGGQILLEAEDLWRQAAVQGRPFVLRLAGIYGPERHRLLDQLRAGDREIAGGQHRLNLAHRDDIVAAILACLSAPTSVGGETFNVADGAPAPREEVIRWLAERLGRPVPRFVDGAASSRRGGPPAPDRIISSARLQARLGWRPRYPDFRVGYDSILGGA